MRFLYIGIFLLAGLAPVVSVAATNPPSKVNTSYVKFGAWVLSKQIRAEKVRYVRTGYLPIGTLVRTTGTPIRLFNDSEAVQEYEDYTFVTSNIGTSGYIKKDLFVQLDEREIIVPLRYRLNVRERDTRKILDTVGRADKLDNALALKVIGESDEYYRVSYARGDRVINGTLAKPLVDDRRAIKISAQSPFIHPHIVVSSPGSFVEQNLDRLTALLDEHVGDLKPHFQTFLASLKSISCRISSDAHVEISKKLFGNGLGLNVNFVVAEKNAIHSIGGITINNSLNLYQINHVKCSDGIPYRLENMILIDRNNLNNQLILRTISLPDTLKKKWAAFDIASSEKMLTIDGYKAYNEFMEHLAKSDFIDKLNTQDAKILSNIILNQIAIFTSH